MRARPAIGEMPACALQLGVSLRLPKHANFSKSGLSRCVFRKLASRGFLPAITNRNCGEAELDTVHIRRPFTAFQRIWFKSTAPYRVIPLQANRLPGA